MCAAKGRLLDLLSLASHDLLSLDHFGVRLAAERAERADEFDQTLNSAKEAHKKALHDYIAHVLQHGCGKAGETEGILAD